MAQCARLSKQVISRPGMCVFMFASVSLKVMGINGHAYVLGLIYLLQSRAACISSLGMKNRSVSTRKKCFPSKVSDC